MSLERARAVADAVMYEGYLLYPYRASAQKNQTRWQFGVLGPAGAAEAGWGEPPQMAFDCLLGPPSGPAPDVTVHVRFLQVQRRDVERADPHDATRFHPADEVAVDGRRLFGWDEAVEQEISWPALPLSGLPAGVVLPIDVAGDMIVEPLAETDGTLVGRILRTRWALHAAVRATLGDAGPYRTLTVVVRNLGSPPDGPADAVRRSLLGAHVLLEARDVAFVSLLEPPPEAASAAGACRQERCWPVLAGPAGDMSLLLGSPIILYDHPQIAAPSAGPLFDATEIDEILTLRIQTMTDDEKAEARATDPRAAEIVDRCDRMTPEEMLGLHGIRREPGDLDGVPWWDPAADESVHPDSDTVSVAGVSLRRGSLVRVHPSRRADAQDLFYDEQVARVSAVVFDVDGAVHVAVVLLDDPAAELHDWYGRYLYFAPDELEPLVAEETLRQEGGHT